MQREGAPMFVEGGGGWQPPPWQPPPRRPKMTRRQERTILWLVGLNAVMLFVAPVGAASIVEAAVAIFSHHGSPAAPAGLGRAAPAR